MARQRASMSFSPSEVEIAVSALTSAATPGTVVVPAELRHLLAKFKKMREKLDNLERTATSERTQDCDTTTPQQTRTSLRCVHGIGRTHCTICTGYVG